MPIDQIVRVYCEVDDFVQGMQKWLNPRMLGEHGRQRIRETELSESERMTLVILFQQSGYRTFKHFYCNHACRFWRHLFPGMFSYNRFINLLPRIVMPLCVFLQTRFGRNTGISFIDSTRLSVCHNKRIRANRVFAGIAKTGKTTMGWFFGFKLHLVINEVGELLAVHVTPGNVDDRQPGDAMTTDLMGKLFGDKGYISQQLFERLFDRGLQFVTHIRRNMKNKLMPWMDKILLRKRSLIETVNDQLKNISQVEHSRHRSPTSFLVNLLAGLIAYTFQPKKPTLKLPREFLSTEGNSALVF